MGCSGLLWSALGCSGTALECSGLLWKGMLLECWLLLLLLPLPLLLRLLALLLPSISLEFQSGSPSIPFRFQKDVHDHLALINIIIASPLINKFENWKITYI